MWIHLVGLIATTLTVLSYQIDDRKKLLTVQTISGSIMAAYYGGLGLLGSKVAFTAMGINFIDAIRNYLFIEKAKSIKLVASYLVIIGLITYFTWSGPLSLLPVLGTVTYLFLLWLNDVRYIRRGVIIVALLWDVYNYNTGAYAAMVCDWFIIISSLIAVYRFDIKKEQKLGDVANGN
ncbi:MAG: YgjV family protein [Clostridia bacterium]|jgi:hypothetical protein|nr:YgjV family protein [Clostridia bacterium]